MDDNEFEKLCDEAHENAVEDRKVLKDHLKKLENFLKKEGDGSAVVLATDAVVKTSDTLAKINAQLIQLAQLKLKSQPEAADEEFDDEDTEEVYSKIEQLSDEEEPDEPN